MKKVLSISVMVLLTLFISGCSASSTWAQTKDVSSEAWEDTKDGTKSAWGQTKKAYNDATK